MKKIWFAAALLGCAVGASFAQEIRVHKQIGGSPHNELALPTFDVITSNVAVDAKQIKGSPFAAEFSSENVQTLADGNRIVRGSVSSFYRDNEGRTRREQSFAQIGALTTNNLESARRVFLSDPTVNFNYVLNPHLRTANRTKFIAGKVITSEVKAVPSVKSAKPQVKIFVSANAPGSDPANQTRFKQALEEIDRSLANSPQPETHEESLGTREIEGVAADGKRVTTVLPAGFMGNEKPIEIVRETWFSKELGIIVLSQTKNPLTGEQTYKLTRLSRGEQPRSLFEVPADYKIVDRADLLNRVVGVPPAGENLPPLPPLPPDANLQFFRVPRSSN